MDSDVLVRRIKRQFGDEYDVVITDDDIFGWIYEAELDIIRNAPDCNIFTQTIINPSGVDFPLAIPNSVSIQRISWNTEPLQYITREWMDDTGISTGDLNSGTGHMPKYWFMSSSQQPLDVQASRSIALAPSPPFAATGNIVVYYSKTPTLLTTVGPSYKLTVPEVYHTDVVSFCLARAHNKNQNAQSEKMQMDMYDRSLTTRRNEANTPDISAYKGTDPLDMEMDWSY